MYSVGDTVAMKNLGYKGIVKKVYPYEKPNPVLGPAQYVVDIDGPYGVESHTFIESELIGVTK